MRELSVAEQSGGFPLADGTGAKALTGIDEPLPDVRVRLVDDPSDC